MTDYQHIIVDTPPQCLSHHTQLPGFQECANNVLRELYSTLESNDRNPDVRVTIIRGAGRPLRGHDLKANNRENQPFHTSPGDGNWARHVVGGFFRVWDLANPLSPKFTVTAWQAVPNCDVLRSRLLRRRCNDRISGGSLYEPARQRFPHLLGLRNAAGMMLTGDALVALRQQSKALPIAPTLSRTRGAVCWKLRNGLPKYLPTSSR